MEVRRQPRRDQKTWSDVYAPQRQRHAPNGTLPAKRRRHHGGRNGFPPRAVRPGISRPHLGGRRPTAGPTKGARWKSISSSGGDGSGETAAATTATTAAEAAATEAATAAATAAEAAVTEVQTAAATASIGTHGMCARRCTAECWSVGRPPRPRRPRGLFGRALVAHDHGASREKAPALQHAADTTR